MGIGGGGLGIQPANKTTAPALGVLTRDMMDVTSRGEAVNDTYMPSSVRCWGRDW